MRSYHWVVLILGAIIGIYSYHIMTIVDRCQHGSFWNENGFDQDKFMSSLDKSDNGCDHTDDNDSGPPNANAGLFANQILATATGLMNTESIIAALKYLGSDNSSIDHYIQMSFIDSLFDNTVILKSLSHDVTPFGRSIAGLLGEVESGKNVPLWKLRELLHLNDIGSVSLLYIRLLEQMKHNYFTEVAQSAINELRINPEIGNVYSQVVKQNDQPIAPSTQHDNTGNITHLSDTKQAEQSSAKSSAQASASIVPTPSLVPSEPPSSAKQHLTGPSPDNNSPAVKASTTTPPPPAATSATAAVTATSTLTTAPQTGITGQAVSTHPVVETPRPPSGVKIALLIGINAYSDPKIPQLDTPLSDVESVGQTLTGYGYKTIIIRNAKKQEVVNALFQLGNDLTPDDKLIIYYGGHGYMFSESKLGYWIPADANTITAASWLSNRDITQFIARIRAHQILMITDSCYSGSIIAGHQIHSAAKGLDDLTIRKRRTVVVLTSGGEEPVADNGLNNHSIFAYFLLRDLDQKKYLIHIGFDLFTDVKDSVTASVPQTPEYGSLGIAGHDEGMDYVFHSQTSDATEAAKSAALASPDDVVKLTADATHGDDRSLQRLLELAQDGHREAQAAVSQAYLNREYSDENFMRATAWQRIADQADKDNTEGDNPSNMKWSSPAARDMKTFLDGIYQRFPGLKGSTNPTLSAP